MADEYVGPSDGFTIDFAYQSFLTGNFHPIVARVAFMNYIFEDNNMQGVVKSAYIKDKLIVHEKEYYQEAWVSRRYSQPLDAWNRLIELVTGMWLPAADIYTYLKEICLFVIWHQTAWTSAEKQNKLSQVKVFEDQIDRVFENLQLTPSDQYLQDHAAVIHTLLGPGSQVLEALSGYCNSMLRQGDNKFPFEQKHNFSVDHFADDPFAPRNMSDTRSIDDLRDKYIDWPRDRSQPGFLSLHFILFLYDINGCFSDSVQFGQFDVKSAEDLKLQMTLAFHQGDTDQILNGQRGYEFRNVDPEIFEWLNQLDSVMFRWKLTQRGQAGGIIEGSAKHVAGEGYRKKRKRTDVFISPEYVEKSDYPLPPPPTTEEEEYFNRPQQRPRIETGDEDFEPEFVPDAEGRNWILPVIVTITLSVAAYGAWKGMKN